MHNIRPSHLVGSPNLFANITGSTLILTVLRLHLLLSLLDLLFKLFRLSQIIDELRRVFYEVQLAEQVRVGCDEAFTLLSTLLVLEVLLAITLARLSDTFLHCDHMISELFPLTIVFLLVLSRISSMVRLDGLFAEVERRVRHELLTLSSLNYL